MSQQQQQQQQQQQKTRIEYMSRRVPVNPRYAGVKAATDTGASLSRHVERINEIKTNFKYRKDELFKRMKISTLVQLMVQVAEFNYDFPPEEIPTMAEEMEEVRSTMQSVISGCGEMSIRERAAGLPSGGEQQNRQQQQQQPRPTLEVPYLLLDVREPDSYAQCHLTTSLNYPSSRLSRVMNFETADLLAYKNREGRIIVLYDEEETLAPRVAQTFVERGYENLFLLSGGMKVALQLFPIGLFVGEPPRHLLPKNNNNNNRGGGATARISSSAPSISRKSSSDTSLHSSSNGGGGGENGNPYYELNNGANVDAAVEDNRLAPRDLDALKMALESALLPPEAREAPKTGRLATAASVGREQRATANAKMTARKEKLVGGREWK